MRKAVAAMTLALGLCGCSDVDSFFGWDEGDAAQSQSSESASPAPPPATAMSSTEPAPSAPAPTADAINAHCTNLARQRASDAAYEGEDEETQEAVYNRTLSACTDWDRRHAL